MAEQLNKPEILTDYLEKNPRVQELLRQWQKTDEAFRKLAEALPPETLAYPFYIYSSNR